MDCVLPSNGALAGLGLGGTVGVADVVGVATALADAGDETTLEGSFPTTRTSSE
jgi:hypothetical protein